MMKNKKPLTQSQFILQWFANNPERSISCVELTKKLIKEFNLTGNVAHYKSGSVSSQLRKLVVAKQLKYAGETKRGGHLYQLDIKNIPVKKSITAKSLESKVWKIIYANIGGMSNHEYLDFLMKLKRTTLKKASQVEQYLQN